MFTRLISYIKLSISLVKKTGAEDRGGNCDLANIELGSLFEAFKGVKRGHAIEPENIPDLGMLIGEHSSYPSYSSKPHLPFSSLLYRNQNPQYNLAKSHKATSPLHHNSVRRLSFGNSRGDLYLQEVYRNCLHRVIATPYRIRHHMHSTRYDSDADMNQVSQMMFRKRWLQFAKSAAEVDVERES